MIFGDSGRRIGDFTVGEETIEKGKSGSANFSESLERVRLPLSDVVPLMIYILSGKRELAQKAEADFFALLRESGIAQDGAIWKEAGHFFVRLFI